MKTDSPAVAVGRDVLLLIAVSVLCFFWRMGSVGLFDFNEALYAQAAREMLFRGDWVAGSVNGTLFFDKPPLALWLTAISYKVLGVNEIAARLPVSIAATALIFLTYWFTARRISRRAGVIAASILAMSPIFLATARQMTMDIHQTLWFAVALVCFYEGYQANTPRGKRWYFGFWAGCGMSFMAKSVPGLFPLLVAAVFVTVDQRFRWKSTAARLWEAKPLAGALILSVIILPWHIAAYLKYGDLFYQEYWVLHHLALLKGTDFDHVQPFWYYLPALLGGMFPWSLFLPLVAFWAHRQKPDAATTFLLIWSAVVLLVFTAMKSKLVSYVLPMYPAAAMLIGEWLEAAIRGERPIRTLTWGMGMAAAVVVLLLAGASAAFWIYTRPGASTGGDFPPQAAVWLLPALAVLGAALIISTWHALHGRPKNSLTAGLLGTLMFSAVAVEAGLRSLDRAINRPFRIIVAEAGRVTRNGTPLAIHVAGPRRPSAFFYMPESALVSKPILERGEIEPLLGFLALHRPAYVIADSGRADRLAREAPGLVTAARNGRWILLLQPAQ